MAPRTRSGASAALPLHSLRDLILKAKHAYYYGTPIMSDAEYDALEDELRLRAPNDPVLAIVGAPVPVDSMLAKARHAMPMGSLGKVNSEEEFRTWATRAGDGALHGSLKGDGASAAAYYRDGRLTQAISRGDGTIGEDITANALRFKGLPAWVEDDGLPFTGAVRFEVILTVEDWGRVDPARKTNPRNLGAGIMGRKNGQQSDLLTVYAFDIVDARAESAVPLTTERAKLARLQRLGFSVIPHQDCDTVDDAVAWFREVTTHRERLPFWIDGVVMKIDDLAVQQALGVTGGRPKGQVAWKFDSAGAETVLEGVHVSGGHTGALVPVAQLRPVEIGGTTVRSASLANYDEIARLDVAIGDTVWLVKANDIIPKIIRVTQRPADRQPIPVPTTCPFCGGTVARRRRSTSGDEGVVLECRNADCPMKSTGKIRRWITSLEIDGIGDAVLEAMVERLGVTDAADLYALRDRIDELAAVEVTPPKVQDDGSARKAIALGEKRAQAIVQAIEATRQLPLDRFLGSLGIETLGKRRVHLMAEAAGGALSTLDAWRSGVLRDSAVAATAGVPNLGPAIQDGIDGTTTLIDRLLAAGVTVSAHAPSTTALAPPSKGRVCISGSLPSGRKKAAYAAPLAAAGYALVEEMSADVAYLVVADPDSTSAKTKKARALGIPIITEETLRQMVGEVA